jgi:hypothetical protein
MQSPANHIEGAGCPPCSYAKRAKEKIKPLSKALKDAEQVHKGRYSYELINVDNYKGSEHKVPIICNSCNKTFCQTLDAHVNQKQGCTTCGYARNSINNTKTINQFKIDANLVHANKYDYSNINNSNYKDSATKIPIICLSCSIEFWQTPNSHLQGQGCPPCGLILRSKNRTKPYTDFIDRAKILYGNEYDYRLINSTNYINITTEVSIIHVKCGSILNIKPSHHLNYGSCLNCSPNDKVSLEEFITRSNITHNNEYDYSENTELKNTHSKVIVIHKKCGNRFSPIAKNHMSGSRCPACSGGIISQQEREWLDHLNLPNDIIHRQVSLRINGKRYSVDGFDPATNTAYYYHGIFYHGHPDFFDPHDINPVSKKSYGTLYANTLIREAAIRSAGYNLVVMWEHDWVAQQKVLKKIAKEAA